MLNIRVPNVNHAYLHGLTLIAAEAVPRSSRYGDVLVVPEPVTTTYYNPTHRVLFHKERDANPFFHLFEALWMLTGADDVECLAYLLPRMREFSDDGVRYHAAYGHRWRKHFGFDQVSAAIAELRDKPLSRRVMIQIWDAREDLGTDSKDLPCNTMVKLELNARDESKLDMVLFNRSNDVIWGAYGANAVQFSMLQEYIATMLGLRVGSLEQISSNYHVYANAWESARRHILDARRVDDYYAYLAGPARVCPLITHIPSFDDECMQVVDAVRHDPHIANAFDFNNEFFVKIAGPMSAAYAYYRNDDLRAAASVLENCIEMYGRYDWLLAGYEWMLRRLAKREEIGE